MPERNYMVVDPRRDHGFRIPRPALAEKIGAPDVCTGCHQDKSLAWAADAIRQRFPASRQDESHFSEVFASIGAKATQQSVEELIELAGDLGQPAIVRATALERCATLPHSLQADDLKPFTLDNSDLVRMAVIGLIRNQDQDQKLPLLLPMLGDQNLSVRLEAAKAMLGIPPQNIPAQYQQDLAQAMTELQKSLLAKADYPEGQMVLGGVALTLKSFQAASQAFTRAVTMDPQLVEAWVILIRIEAALGNTAEARNLLLQALQNNPDSYQIEDLAASMGLSYERSK